MRLEQLGWNEYFKEMFTRYAGAEEEPGRVVSASSSLYHVAIQKGTILAEATGRLAWDGELPVVGDWVVIRESRISAVLDRQSGLSRNQAGGVTGEQVLAANIDVVFIVTGLDHNFKIRRLERYLVLVSESGARPVVVLNKADLAPSVEAARTAAESVAGGFPVITLSALEGEGLEQLEELMTPGETAVLVGSSGVGKSTIVNRLLGGELQRTRQVRSSDSRGRHTTTNRELIPMPQGWMLIDTPGLRELQLWATSDSLGSTFDDIESLSGGCRFRDCTHQEEPGCAVREAILSGEADAGRLSSYHKLQREISHLEAKQDEQVAHQRKAETKRFHKMIRRFHHR